MITSITIARVEIHCVSQRRIHDIFSCNSSMHSWNLVIFGRNISQKVGSFPLHLTSVSALPCITGNTEITPFHLTVVCCFANKHTKYIKIITWS